MILCFSAFSQSDSNRITPIYERYKVALDRGDTLKFKSTIAFSHSSHWKGIKCAGSYSLTQIIKKNDSVLIIHKMKLPCLIEHTRVSRYNKIGFPEDIKGFNTLLNNMKMPSIESFDYTPFSIEVPIQIQNLIHYNIQGITGKMTIINRRKDVKDKEIFYDTIPKYSEFTFEDILLDDFFEYNYVSRNDTLNPVEKVFRDYLFSDYNNTPFQINIDFFSPHFKYQYGDAPTFYLSNNWALYSTRHFVVILENIQNKQENDILTFRRMAESIKPIDPNVFSLQDLDSYILIE